MTSRTDRDVTTTFATDTDRRLITPGASATFAYGASGMREHVSVTTPEGTTSTESVWDGQTLIAERDSDGTIYRYVHGPDGSPLSLVRTRPGAADERFSYHTDALGSVVAITSEAGTVVATYRYGAFGELLATGGSDAALASRNPLRYRAYYYDTHSALYYLPARYFDPASARFLSPDPAPASAGDPRTLDRYMYCTGDPVNYYDPTGAYLAAGGGSSKVSDEAIALAKDDLAAAIAVQAVYRKAVSASYASGLSYDAAHVAAAQAAAERAAALAEREKIDIAVTAGPIALGVLGVVAGAAAVFFLATAAAPAVIGATAVAGVMLSAGGLWATTANQDRMSPQSYRLAMGLGYVGLGASLIGLAPTSVLAPEILVAVGMQGVVSTTAGTALSVGLALTDR